MNRILDRKIEEQQMMAAGRLPPGQSLTKKFPILHYGPVPDFDPETWDFRVYGEVKDGVWWTWNSHPTTGRVFGKRLATIMMQTYGKKNVGSLGIAVTVRVCGGIFVVEPQKYPHIPPPRQLPESQNVFAKLTP